VLDQAGERALHTLAAQLFAGHATTLRQVTWTEQVVDGHPAVAVSAEVHYAVPRLPSRFDRLSAVVVQLEDGSVVVALSSVPDDADPAVAELASQSLLTLRVS
jgi:hypothetical protein